MKNNILLISADGLRYDALHANGNSLALTPNLDRLASIGVRFERAYCSQPICMPCRASVLTGRYPSTHGVWKNGVTLSESEPMLTKLLSSGGYSTACYGKTHFRPWLQTLLPDEDHPRPEYSGSPPYYGFDRIDLVDHSSDDAYTRWVEQRHPQHAALAKNPRLDRPSAATIAWKSTLPREATRSQFIADRTIAALQNVQREDSPFLIWSSFIDPHHPYNPPAPHHSLFDNVDFPRPPANEGPQPELPAQYKEWTKVLRETWKLGDTAQTQWLQVRRMYQSKVHHLDYQIGRVLDALEATQQAESTIVVFFSDHGCMLGDYGLMQVGDYSQEALIRIPMIWSGPGIQRGVTEDGLVSVVDLLPTLLEFAGLPIPTGPQGMSLRPILDGSSSEIRDAVIVENRWGQQPPDGFKTLITSRYKISVYTNGEEGELYDLKADPDEVRNLFHDPDTRDVRNQLISRYATELMKIEDPLPIRTGAW